MLNKSVFLMPLQKKFIILVLIFFALLISINSKEKDISFPQKLIFLNPENNKDNQTELIPLLIDETVASLEDLDKEAKIIFMRKKKWERHEHLISDLNNHEDIGNFFSKTNITGIISFAIEKKYEKIVINLLIYDLREKKLYIEGFDLFNTTILDDFSGYINFAKSKIAEYFPPLNLEKLKKEKIRNRIMFRSNPEYELLLSGGLGYFSRQGIGENVFSHGFTSYVNLETKLYNFAIDFHVEFSPLFNDTALVEDVASPNYFLFNYFMSVNLGAWLVKQTFKIALGTAFQFGDFFISSKSSDNSDIRHNYKLTAYLLFCYLNFSFLPIRAFQMFFDVGAFFSPVDISYVGISYFFPMYLRLGVRFFIYKQLFIEMNVPYYLIKITPRIGESDGDSPSFQAMINVGVGWRFEWGRR